MPCLEESTDFSTGWCIPITAYFVKGIGDATSSIVLKIGYLQCDIKKLQRFESRDLKVVAGRCLKFQIGKSFTRNDISSFNLLTKINHYASVTNVVAGER